MRKEIQVLKGQEWQASDKFILQDHKLVERIKTTAVPCINKLEVQDKAGKSAVTVTVDNCSAKARMMLYATTFLP